MKKQHKDNSNKSFIHRMRQEARALGFKDLATTSDWSGSDHPRAASVWRLEDAKTAPRTGDRYLILSEGADLLLGRRSHVKRPIQGKRTLGDPSNYPGTPKSILQQYPWLFDGYEDVVIFGPEPLSLSQAIRLLVEHAPSSPPSPAS